MANANLISTPNIDGNISSCKTEVSVINCSSRDSLFYCQDVGYATNNCTGETIVHHSWSVTGFSIFLMVLIGIIVFCVGIRIASD